MTAASSVSSPRLLTLSFDNGPHPRVTPLVLDVLREHGARAHFFVLGKHLATPAGAALVARARDEGHLVGNHSYTHETPLGLDPRPDAVQAEIEATEALLAPIVRGEKRFRPFGGGGVIGPHLLRADVVSFLLEHEYGCILWNSVPRDWEDPVGWTARALADLETHAHTLLVLHDVEGACLDQLAGFLAGARALGVDITLDLPADCVPIARGQILFDLTPLVASADDAKHVNHQGAS
jgi:peptidoglycan/xylan/chitin deacetylase (PgdA/CDA1 family)